MAARASRAFPKFGSYARHSGARPSDRWRCASAIRARAASVLGPAGAIRGGDEVIWRLHARRDRWGFFLLVGAPRFELGTPSPPDWCANRAALRSDGRAI